MGRIYFPSEAKMILVGSVESGLECLLFRAVCVGRFFLPPGPNLGLYLLYDGVGLVSLK